MAAQLFDLVQTVALFAFLAGLAFGLACYLKAR